MTSLEGKKEHKNKHLGADMSFLQAVFKGYLTPVPRAEKVP